MKLAELRETISDTAEEPDEDDRIEMLAEMEEDLSDAHELLKDSMELFEQFMQNDKVVRKMGNKDYRKMKKVAEETLAYLSQWVWEA